MKNKTWKSIKMWWDSLWTVSCNIHGTAYMYQHGYDEIWDCKACWDAAHGKKRDEVDDIILEAKERADGACVHCLELKKKGVEPGDYPHYHKQEGGGEI